MVDEPSNAEVVRLQLLVLRCQAGDEDAFAKLFREFAPKTLAYLRGVLDDDADDVQQEVWLTVYRNLRGLAKPGVFRTWLFSTTRHRAIDFLRRRKRERELLTDVPAETVDIASPTDDEMTVLGPEMDEALAALPAPQREVLLLRYGDGLDYGEIAVVVGVAIGTVRSRLHHAKKRLKELLTQA